jgi:hypothetical protein
MYQWRKAESAEKLAKTAKINGRHLWLMKQWRGESLLCRSRRRYGESWLAG